MIRFYLSCLIENSLWFTRYDTRDKTDGSAKINIAKGKLYGPFSRKPPAGTSWGSRDQII